MWWESTAIMPAFHFSQKTWRTTLCLIKKCLQKAVYSHLLSNWVEPFLWCYMSMMCHHLRFVYSFFMWCHLRGMRCTISWYSFWEKLVRKGFQWYWLGKAFCSSSEIHSSVVVSGSGSPVLRAHSWQCTVGTIQHPFLFSLSAGTFHSHGAFKELVVTGSLWNRGKISCFLGNCPVGSKPGLLGWCCSVWQVSTDHSCRQLQ